MPASEIYLSNKYNIKKKLGKEIFNMIVKIYNVDSNLLYYIKKEIIPLYDTMKFDCDHKRDHIYETVSNAFNIAAKLKKADKDKLNPNIILCCCVYHDIGMIYGDENDYNIHSARIVQGDPKLKAFFKDGEIKIISDAVFDGKNKPPQNPKTIYGSILCDANILSRTSLEHMMERAYNFLKTNSPEFEDDEEKIDEIHRYLNKSYGKEETTNLFLAESEKILRRVVLQNTPIIKNKKLLKKVYNEHKNSWKER